MPYDRKAHLREYMRDYVKRFWAINPDASREEYLRAYMREYMPRYRMLHPERIRAANKKWCDANKDRVAAYNRKYYQEHKNMGRPRKRGPSEEQAFRIAGATTKILAGWKSPDAVA